VTDPSIAAPSKVKLYISPAKRRRHNDSLEQFLFKLLLNPYVGRGSIRIQVGLGAGLELGAELGHHGLQAAELLVSEVADLRAVPGALLLSADLGLEALVPRPPLVDLRLEEPLALARRELGVRRKRPTSSLTAR